MVLDTWLDPSCLIAKGQKHRDGKLHHNYGVLPGIRLLYTRILPPSGKTNKQYNIEN